VSCVPALQQCQSPTGDFSGTKYSLLKYSSVSDSFFIKIYNLCMMSRKKLVLYGEEKPIRALPIPKIRNPNVEIRNNIENQK
jgi:hypothetical protein